MAYATNPAPFLLWIPCLLFLSSSLLASETTPEIPEDILNTAEPVKLQIRFLLGSAFPTSPTTSTNFPISGTPPSVLEPNSGLSGGTVFSTQIGGLGPKGESGAFVDFLYHRQKASFHSPAPSADLGYLSSLGILFCPNIGKRFTTKNHWEIRPYVEFGAGIEFSWFDPIDSTLLPAPPTPGASPVTSNARNLGWKAGFGVDLRFSKDYGIVASLNYHDQSPIIPIKDSISGTEIGRLTFQPSSWQWLLGVAYGY